MELRPSGRNRTCGPVILVPKAAAAIDFNYSQPMNYPVLVFRSVYSPHDEISGLQQMTQVCTTMILSVIQTNFRCSRNPYV
jgi:hypothetical protein